MSQQMPIPVEAAATVNALLAQVSDLSLNLAITKAQLDRAMKLIPSDVLAAVNGGDIDDDADEPVAES